MVREILLSGCGIKFDPDALARANIDLHTELTYSEMVSNNADALEPIHDELKRRKLWWLLEILPLGKSWQDKDGVWRKRVEWVPFPSNPSKFCFGQ